MQKALLTPQISVGPIKLDDSIENYPTRALEFSETSGDETYSCFSFSDIPVQAFVNEEGQIETIRCETECIWEGENLVGLGYADFQKRYPDEPDDVDRIPVETADGEQEQDVYDYDDLGLQLWVADGKIALVMVSSFEEED